MSMRIEIAEIENRNVIGDDPAVYSDHDEGTLPHQPPTEKSDVIGPRGRKSGLLSETSDDYSRVVAVLDRGRSRVIVCAAGIQWIVQNRRGQQWHSRSFCQTKNALIRCCGCSTPELDALPDRIGDRVEPTTDMQEAAE
jgi:hypothetical protein